ncbi:ribonuclease E activity regulator RraA [Halioxenophilus aromaticivorans]|uniref:4-hydroxy-4-methyl-2-oxoglutarate aldolase n=1 Tax=Halioxenophilus aromaticivorans TaxID=1306992 RepID=A0AAV3TYQ7_9ALTE
MSQWCTPDICDAYPDDVRVLHLALNSYGGKSNFYGEVVTIKCHEDNSLVKEQASKPGNGRVMVVDGGGSLRRALLGDMIAEAAVKNGWAGLVIYGCVRDVDALADLSLGVKALASIPLKTEKRGIGDLNVELEFGGAVIKAGDTVYADNNGVVFSDSALDLTKI